MVLYIVNKKIYDENKEKTKRLIVFWDFCLHHMVGGVYLLQLKSV